MFLRKGCMFKILRGWFNRYFSDPEAILLLVVLLVGFELVIWMGGILAPVFASIVFAYLLGWVVNFMQRFKIPRIIAVWVVFLGFMGLFLATFIFLFPLLWKQVATLFNDLPTMMGKGQQVLEDFVARYPQYFSEEQIRSFSTDLLTEARNMGKVVLSISWSSLMSVITWLVYLVLVPLLVFFFLKDQKEILNWMGGFLPHKRGILIRVSTEVNTQIGNYIRGKVVEIIFVAVFTFAVFWYFDLRYSVLLASLVGLSVLIPYVGAIVITIPVVLVGYLQWGFEAQFGYMLIAYLVVQGLDANVLVPLLFSEAVNLHPIAIVVAVLFFGGIWGFWGVFFAIPLATLVKAVLYAWPSQKTV